MKWNACAETRGQRAAAFTLLELIVVISIIIVLTAGSVAALSTYGRGGACKQAGRIVQSQFYRARQLAASSRFYHFMRIDAAQNRMTIFRDNPNAAGGTPRKYDAATDTMVGTPVDLPKGVDFKIRAAGSPNGIPDPMWIWFRPDGSLATDPLAGGLRDFAIMAGPFDSWGPEPTGDIVVRQQDGGGACVLDWNAASGKILKIIYVLQCNP